MEETTTQELINWLSREPKTYQQLDDGGKEQGVFTQRILALPDDDTERTRIKGCFAPGDAVVLLEKGAIDSIFKEHHFCRLWEFCGKIADVRLAMDGLLFINTENIAVRVGASGKMINLDLCEIAAEIAKKGTQHDLCIVEDTALKDDICQVMILTA